jgi:Tfp pilus assembly protein PilX
MSMNLLRKSKVVRDDAGIALITSLLLLFLMSSLLVGFCLLLATNQQLAGSNNDDVTAFYGAEAGMEQMTANLGDLFAQTYSPSMAQINAITLNPPLLPNVQFLTSTGTSGYTIQPAALDNNGNPAPTISTVKSGTYAGMTAMLTEYTMQVNARTTAGREVKLQRAVQTVGIPMFQFGVFSDMDLSFHAGPNFSFGGRTHTNGNLFLCEGDGDILTMSDKVDAYKDVIRTNMANGWPTSSNYTGTVRITTQPGSSNYRNLGMSEGSLTGTIGSSADTNWPLISTGSAPTDYNSNLTNGAGSAYPQYSTGSKQLNLGIVTMGGGTTQSIDLVRRPVQGEASNITGERYFAQASLQILLSDNPADIMNLPCVDQSTQPFDLSQLAQPVANWPASASVTQLQSYMTAYGTTPLPLAASGAATNTTSASSYASADGYWLPYGYPIIKGFIKIEAQTSYGSPCGTWKDVTTEILGLGYVGRNLNRQTNLTAGQYGAPTNTAGAPLSGASLPSSQLAPSTCPDPHPNAVIRLERVRDNPSTWAKTNASTECGTVSNTSPPSDFWNNTLFDTREGELRDNAVTSGAYQNLPTLNGTMHYIELDAKNLTKWFAGSIGASGPSTKDPNIAPNDFTVYFSDRRGNYTSSQAWTGTWPPLSPSGHETGEYGWTDFANGTNAANGCPNNTLDPGEDLDAAGQEMTYGVSSTDVAYIMKTGTAQAALTYGQFGFYNNLTTAAILANPNCSAPSYSGSIWPMMFAANANAARENPPIFFRRSLKIVNGNLLTALGTCPGGVVCGLAISSENPIYIQGDYNANSAGNGFSDPNVAASVAGDAITLLSDNWNDVNSFAYNEYNLNGSTRTAKNTYWRTAAVAGKGIAFPYFNDNGDNGSDGGIHNFLRYVEDWTNQTIYYTGSLVSMYTNRQATGIYKCCTTVYSPPTRGYQFDTNFLTPALLPPRTPLFRDVNTTGWTRLLLPSQ